MRWLMKLMVLLGMFVGITTFTVEDASAGPRWRGGYGAAMHSGGYVGQWNYWNYGPAAMRASPTPDYVLSGAYGAAAWESPAGTYSNPRRSGTVIVGPFRRW